MLALGEPCSRMPESKHQRGSLLLELWVAKGWQIGMMVALFQSSLCAGDACERKGTLQYSGFAILGLGLSY